MKRCLSVAIWVAWLAGPMAAATLERLTLDEMIAKSTSIVRGTVTESWSAFTGRDIYTHYKIQVAEQFKGTKQNTVEIVVPGGTVGQLHQTVAGAPVLLKGTEGVFFLWTSQSGATWIMGLTQGLFTLGGTNAADPTATRTASRELMLDPATARPVKDAAVSLKLSDLRTRIAAAAQGGQQ